MDLYLEEKLAQVLGQKVKASPDLEKAFIELSKILSFQELEEMILVLEKEPDLAKEILSYWEDNHKHGGLPNIWTTDEVREIFADVLRDKEGKFQCLRWVLRIENNGEPGDARIAYQVLYSLLSSIGLDKNNVFYQRQLWRLGWLSFAIQTEVVATSLINQALLWGLRDGIPIRARIEARLLGTIDGMVGEVGRQSLLSALGQNEEILGTGKIKITGDPLESPSTITNWLRDYSRSSSHDRGRTTTDEIFYLEHNQNVRNLSTVDRDWLFQILSFYDFLMYRQVESSITVSWRAETLASRPSIFNRLTQTKDKPVINQQPVTKSNKSVVSSQVSDIKHLAPVKLEDIFSRFQREQTEVAKLVSTVSADPLKSLREAVAAQNRLRTLAALQASCVISYGSGVIKLVGDDADIKTELYNYLDKKLGHAAALAYKLNSKRPVWVGWYWRYVLVEKLKMDENEAKLWTVTFGNQLGGEYKKFVYLDQTTKELKWNEAV